jgi:hypothetical protein
VSDVGPKLKRPATTFKKKDAFQRRMIQNGNVVYMCELCSFNAPTEDGVATIDLAKHTNGAVFKITYKGVNFAAPSLSPLGGMNTSAVFDLHDGQKAFQKKLAERGCEDVLIDDEISDVAADGDTLIVTTKMMSESTPSERRHGRLNMNDTFVSDIVHTKRIQNVSPGVVDYKVKLNIPANYVWGVVEILSSSFFNDILIQLMKRKSGWEVMKNATYSNGGFVIAKDPETAMGVVLVDWPKGAVLFPPKVHYNEFEDVNRWSVTQQIGSPLNDSVKVPGGEYSWGFKILFGPIWFCQGKINEIKLKPHGNEHEVLFADDVSKRRVRDDHARARPAHGYPYI